MPWLLSLAEAEYRAVQLQFAARARRKTRGTQDAGLRCGTDILAYLPFDPTSESWEGFLARRLCRPAADPGRGGSGAAGTRRAAARVTSRGTKDEPPRGPGGSAGVPALATEVSSATQSRVEDFLERFAGRGGAALPALGLDDDLGVDDFLRRLGVGSFELPASTLSELTWDAGRPELSCERLKCLFDTSSRNWASIGTSSNWRYDSGRGMLISRNASTRLNRPVMDVLCAYLRDYWQALLASGSSFGTYPFDSGAGEFGRHEFSGWPGANGAPAADLPVPGGTLETLTDSAFSWFRVHGNFWLARNVSALLYQEHPAIPATQWNFGAHEIEADTIGLALRLLEASFQPLGGAPSAFRHWESLYTGDDGPTFGFVVAGNDVVEETTAWHNGSLAHSLAIVVRSGLDGIGDERDASGRGNAADRTVSLNREHPRVSRAINNLSLLRNAALGYVQLTGPFAQQAGLPTVPDCASRPSPSDLTYGLNQNVFWNAAADLVDLAELILHKATHVLCWSRWSQASGISGEWFDGPAHGEPTASLASIQSYDFSSGAVAVTAINAGVVPPWFAGQIPSTSIRVHPHYAVTLFGVWWVAVFRHNRAPLMDLQRASCACPAEADGPMVPQFPLHWGWFDFTCGAGALPPGVTPLGWDSRSSWVSTGWDMGNEECIDEWLLAPSLD